MWHEALAGRGSNQTASILYMYLVQSKQIKKRIHGKSLPHINPTHIYTDAYILGGHVGMAIIHEEIQIQCKLSEKCSIHSAEALAILIHRIRNQPHPHHST